MKTQWKMFLLALVSRITSCDLFFVCLFITFRVVVLESRPTDNPTANSNLYILAGHENSY